MKQSALVNQSVFVVLLERNPIQREGIAAFLRSGGFSNCIACARHEELYKVESSPLTRVLFLIDFDHEEVPVGKIVRELHSHYSDCAVVVLTEKCSTSVLMDVMRSEADGLLVKQIEAEVLVKSLELVLLGERIFPADALIHFLERDAADDAGGDSDTRARLARLSVREREVLLCLEAGDSNKAIARAFGITESTVKVHVKAILRKILVKNRTQAAVWAKRTRLHPTPENAVTVVASSSPTIHQAFSVGNGACILNDQN